MKSALLALIPLFSVACGSPALTAGPMSPGAAPGSPPGSGVLNDLSDSFSRSVSGGWGMPDSGPEWLAVGNPQGASVDGASGRLTVTVAPGSQFMSAPLGVHDVEVSGRWRLDAPPAGANSSIHFYVRVRDPDVYRFYVSVSPNGDLAAKFEVLIGGTATLLGDTARVGTGYVAGQWWHVHIQVEGSAPTTMRARVWQDGTSEPTGWAIETSDASPTLQADSQSVRFGLFASVGTTLPVSAAFDDVQVTSQP